MKSPCIGQCQNIEGLCAGCHRTMDEILNWTRFDDAQREQIMQRLSGESHTHRCPNCQSKTYCGHAAGEKYCWCFDIEKRDLSELKRDGNCLCRGCLVEAPLA